MQPSDPPSAPARRAVPRPPHHRAGSEAPWAGLPAGDRRSITLDRVLGAVGASRAGPPTDADRRGPWRSLAGTVVEGEPAAVLVALFEEDGETRVILTVRSDRLRSHQGEVAFPGGRLDDGEGVVAGALREAFEEVGLDPRLVAVVGELTPMPTRASNTVMTPVVATLDARPGLVPNPGEVERVFDVALSELAADGVFHEEWWAAPGRPASAGFPEGEFPVWFFELAGETVWGATARTLVELICPVLGVPAPPSLRW
ncbi:MAG TPA: CoA pyrophosphatase [Acidimicrobiales bacterium]|nr:CoA pyrophosphatase [Acidimicrobiales bacterium]